MDPLLYFLARGLIGLVQALPLVWVARLGRWGGWLAYWTDARHRRVAHHNLALCLGAEKSPAELGRLARENFQRIGENFACAVKTTAMALPELRRVCELAGGERLLSHFAGSGGSIVVAIGHFGNFELYARAGQFLNALRCVTTYRGLRQPALDRLWQSLREQSGCRYFERRKDAAALKAALRAPGTVLGLLADQHAGAKGMRLPFLGQDCSTNVAPAVFALRYHAPLHTAICYRVGLARWRIEIGDQIPTREHGRPRSIAAISLDIHRAFEAAIRRDPANWFWVHNRWKSVGSGPPPG